MKKVDIIFAFVCGLVIGSVGQSFFSAFGARINFWHIFVFFILFPLFSVFCLWLAFLVGRKYLFVFQIAKHLLVGAFVTVLDLWLFEFFVWLFLLPLASKSISFILATVVKYWGNKRWAFEHHRKESILKEMAQFFTVTAVGLTFDVSVFYYLTQVLAAPNFMPSGAWVKLSIILAGASAVAWNFTAYKFLVFKK